MWRQVTLFIVSALATNIYERDHEISVVLGTAGCDSLAGISYIGSLHRKLGGFMNGLHCKHDWVILIPLAVQ